MTKSTPVHPLPVTPRMEEAWQAVDACFGRFCLTAGIEALQAMMVTDVEDLCGKRHARGPKRRGHRWGRTQGTVGYHGGKVDVVRPRVRGRDGDELVLPSWAAATAEDWLGKTAKNLMLIGVATRKIGRAVRLPEGRLRQVDGDGTSKSAASRRFVALSQERMEAWLQSDLSKLDLLVIQIDGLHVAEDIVLIGAIGIDGHGEKHILGLVEGATENAAATQALLNNLVERGLDPAVLFNLDGAKALSSRLPDTRTRPPCSRTLRASANSRAFRFRRNPSSAARKAGSYRL